MRLFVGFAVLPFVAALFIFISFVAVEYALGPLYGGAPSDSFDQAVAFTASAAFLAFVVTWVGVVPIVFWLRRQRRMTLKSLLVAGVLLGNLPFFMTVGSHFIVNLVMAATSRGAAPWSGWRVAFLLMAMGSFTGMLSATVFWAIGVWGTGVDRAGGPRASAVTAE